MKKLIKSFIVSTTNYLPPKQQVELVTAVNLHFLGDPHCNTADGQPKYPEKETPEFLEANRMNLRPIFAKLKVCYYDDATYTVELVDKKK